jgi:hypothetical protein
MLLAGRRMVPTGKIKELGVVLGGEFDEVFRWHPFDFHVIAINPAGEAMNHFFTSLIPMRLWIM